MFAFLIWETNPPENGVLTAYVSQVIRFGSKTYPLKASPERHVHDIYKRGADASTDLTYAGSVTHSLAGVEAEKSNPDMDAALAQLKNNLANIEQEKEARQ